MKHEESQVYSVPLTVPNATLKTVKIEDDFPILPSSNSSWDAQLRRNLDLLAAPLCDELWRSFGN